jgi:hypothetical protein
MNEIKIKARRKKNTDVIGNDSLYSARSQIKFSIQRPASIDMLSYKDINFKKVKMMCLPNELYRLDESI